MGSGYVVDYCISAINRRREREEYEYYITDAAYVIMKSLQSKIDIKRFYDMKHPAKVDERTAEEIAADIIARHGLKVVT